MPFEILPARFVTGPLWVQRSRGVKQLLGTAQNLHELAVPGELRALRETELLRKAPRTGPEIGGESHTYVTTTTAPMWDSDPILLNRRRALWV